MKIAFRRPQLSMLDVAFIVAAVAIAMIVARGINVQLGGVAFVFLLVLWRTRHRKYSAIPGAAIGVLVGWFWFSGMNPTALIFLTMVNATIGASINAILRGYYCTGIASIMSTALIWASRIPGTM